MVLLVSGVYVCACTAKEANIMGRHLLGHLSLEGGVREQVMVRVLPL